MMRIPRQRDIIDRRALWSEIRMAADADGMQSRPVVLEKLRAALEQGRTEIASRLMAKPSAGYECNRAQAFLVDQLVRIIHDYIVRYQYPPGNRSAAQRLTIMAVGGYGRAEMAPHSDVDIAFLTPMKKKSWPEQVVEAMLYFLWDLGLKVGHSSRSLDEMVRMAKADVTIRTALLEGRYVWGDEDIYAEAAERFQKEVVSGTARDFVAQKLAERDARHMRMGDSRYVVEPNVKDGKGGLRDLQTLYWIGKYVHDVRVAADLVEAGLLTTTEYRGFRRAENFLLAVRSHLHMITGRAEDRLTFDLQREVATRMQFADRPGKSAVERFMQYYFLNAKKVGDLTGVFLAQLDEKFAARGRRFLPSITRRPRKLKGFKLDRGRLSVPGDDFFAKEPLRLMQMFQLADRYELEIHPAAMRLAGRDAKLIDSELRNDAEANKMFMHVLTSPRDPEIVLRWMNEAGIFGRFVPDFGRVVAQMQFDMYHHYTVDEHTIRAIGLLSKIEAGRLEDDHPLSHAILKKLASRRVLYVATLLHDIAKGRKGDHSILGAEVAMKLCPRLGLSQAETELAAWLVRNHLLMSATAFKRDLADYKTIADFAAQVKSPERLKLLLVLTIVDIRAVGPGVWNSWKRQLLRTLFEATEEVLRLGHKEHGRKEKIAAKKADVAAMTDLPKTVFAKLARQLTDPYWIAEPEDIIARNIRHMRGVGDTELSIEAEFYEARGATLVTVYAADHPGLFYRIAGGIHLAGGNIIDARIHTTKRGMALDNFLVQDPQGRPFNEADQIERLKVAITDALANRHLLVEKLDARPLAHPRSEAFHISPMAIIDNEASNRFTVIEVNAHDRPALLSRLARTLFDLKLIVHSAHISTYGERAVDTFYVTDLLGAKIESKARLRTLEKKLVEAASDLPDDLAETAEKIRETA
ncbi:[protein-PII] uridylyltransferase [Sphingorhabdus sp. Alg239-R122]|uniref:[protein-PII] uridylyltransferase n=1 Tax=Sphingorhabdus sp. Alg239-R122 TaxID=2305989 RepID=UPI0013D96984|nr:[protein-PII] uridylyltransferase [Sphingorhabdus sp. Alg239-R122]